MRYKKLLILLIFVSSCSGYKTFQPWTNEEIVVESVHLAFSYIDYNQTINIQDKGGWEMNQSLGEHPSDQEIAEYFICTRLLHFTFVYFLDHNERIKFQMFTLGANIVTVYWNFRMGF